MMLRPKYEMTLADRQMRKVFNNLLVPIAAIAFILTAASLSVFAQSTGGVKGKLKNPNGKGIANAEVAARQNNEDIKTTKTDKNGNFTLSGLTPGIYNIAFDAAGYSTGVKFNVEIKSGNTLNLGDNLILAVDRGSLVIIQGSVFTKNGRSIPGARIEVEKIAANGSAKKVTTVYTNVSGEFNLRQPEGAARFRITAKFRDKTASKEIEVDSAAIYRLALTIDIEPSESN